ncbi:MAG: flagellar biosynthetic protein FliO [Pirellulaceae bacterium]
MNQNYLPSAIRSILLFGAILLSLTHWTATTAAQMPTGGESPTQLSMPAMENASPSNSGLQDVAENSMSWLASQIAPPSADGEQSSWSLLSDPETKRSAMKTGATLTLVISVFLLLVFVLRMRPSSRRKRGGLPDEVVSVLGQTKFGQTQQLQLIRLGSKLLLVTTSQAGSHTLGEITDPEEVFQIETMCREGKFNSLSETLRQRAAESAASRRQTGVSLGSTRVRSGRTLLEA